MSSLLTKPIVQHHRTRVSPIQLRDFPLTNTLNLRNNNNNLVIMMIIIIIIIIIIRCCQPVVTLCGHNKVEKHPSGRKTYNVLSIQRGDGNNDGAKYSEKSGIFQEIKRGHRHSC